MRAPADICSIEGFLRWRCGLLAASDNLPEWVEVEQFDALRAECESLMVHPFYVPPQFRNRDNWPEDGAFRLAGITVKRATS